MYCESARPTEAGRPSTSWIGCGGVRDPCSCSKPDMVGLGYAQTARLAKVGEGGEGGDKAAALRWQARSRENEAAFANRCRH